MDRAEVVVDLDVIGRNVETLVELVRPAALCAVVKADAYGHGAEQVGPIALAAGADTLAVATVGEAARLRQVGVTDRVVVLSEPARGTWPTVVELGLDCVVTSLDVVAGLSSVATAFGRTVRVHVKVDTGMHRTGCPAGELGAVVAAVADRPGVELAGLCSHLATAERGDHTLLNHQRRLFEAVTEGFGPFDRDGVRRHLANSAGGALHPECRYEMVRAGILVYGLDPGGAATALLGRGGLEPALGLSSSVTAVRLVVAGEGVSYGATPVPHTTTVVTVPLGYADGIPRRAGFGVAEVLIRGRRWMTVGAVTMDQLMLRPVNRADAIADVEVGDEVVLIGSQGDDEVPVAEWANRLGTIDYEIVAGLRHRVPRVWHPRPA